MYLKVCFGGKLQNNWKAISFLFIFLVMWVRDWRNVCKKVRQNWMQLISKWKWGFRRESHENQPIMFKIIFISKENNWHWCIFYCLSHSFLLKKSPKPARTQAVCSLCSFLNNINDRLFSYVEKPKPPHCTICPLHLNSRTISTSERLPLPAKHVRPQLLHQAVHTWVGGTVILCCCFAPKTEPHFCLPGGKEIKHTGSAVTR